MEVCAKNINIMKTHSPIINFILFFILFFLLHLNARAFEYRIAFTGSGTSSTIDSVVVQNLYKSTQVTVPGGSQLRLTDEESTIGSLKTIADFAYVYPNPIIDNATYSFVAKNDGSTQISVFGLDGRKITGMDIHLSQGKQSFQLTLPKGVYLIQSKGNGFSYTTKIIILSITDNHPQISYKGNVTNNKPQKVGAPEVKMQYTTGDQLLYKGYSGNYCTIVTDKPTETKTTDFKFVDCTDADGNHYAVVHIGTQTWMAENLKTTRYRDNVTISIAWAFIFNNDMNNLSIYGRLYNWSAIADSRNISPLGWHVPTNEEWILLENYLIENGYNYDGTYLENKVAKSMAASISWVRNTATGRIGNDLTKNNSSGFSALPGGFRYRNNGTFDGIGHEGYWWSSTAISTINAMTGCLATHLSSFLRYDFDKTYGFSVRCVKD